MVVEKKPDRRKVRTRKLLRDALIELIVEKGYDTITVQDIADRANIARATFYLHYNDKEDLLIRSFEDVYDDLVARLAPMHTEKLLNEGYKTDIVAFEHVAEYANFYKVMLSRHGVASFSVRMRHYLAKVARDLSANMLPKEILDSPIFDAMLHQQAGGLIAMISWWLENDMPYTPEEMAKLSHRIGLHGCWALIEEGKLLDVT